MYKTQETEVYRCARLFDQGELRLIDYAFRYSEDEFVIWLPQTGKDAAVHLAKRFA